MELSLTLCIRVIGLAAVGAICSFASKVWVKNLFEKRHLQYSLSKRNNLILTLAMAFAGGAIGFFTEGFVYPILALLLLMVSGTIAISDYTQMIIPNQTVLAIFGIKFLLVFLRGLDAEHLPQISIVDSLLGLIACFVVFCLPSLMGNKVGAGDVKLAAAMGFLLGTINSLYGIVLMGLLILAYGFVQKKMPVQVFLRTNVPMGPFIAIGMMAAFTVPNIIPRLFAG